MKSKNTKKSLTFATLMSLLVISPVLSMAAFSKPVLAQGKGKGNCGFDYIAKDESDPFSYSGAEVITSVFVKAGSAKSTDGNQCTELTLSNTSNGVYQAEGLGTNSVTVSLIDNEGKDISHVEFYADQAQGQDNPDSDDDDVDANDTSNDEVEEDESGENPQEESDDQEVNTTPTATPTGSECPEGSSVNANGVCAHPQPQNDPGANTGIGGGQAASAAVSFEDGQVLGVDSLADTGAATGGLINAIGALGTYLMGLSLKKKEDK